jgi:dienelactone hydrolase
VAPALGLGAPQAAAAATERVQLAGAVTTVDFYAPAGADSRDAVVFAHGFTRDRHTMAGHAQRLANAGVWAVVPDLPFLLDSRDNAVALRELVRRLRAGLAGPRLERIVLVGFSAGGLSALLAADEPGIVAYVGLDPFDRPSGVGLAAAKRLPVPAFVLRGPSAGCNAFLIAEPWLEAFPRLQDSRQLPEATHCDFEAPTDAWCRLVCGEETPAHQAEVAAFISSAVHAALATPSGGPGPPGGRAGPAAATPR